MTASPGSPAGTVIPERVTQRAAELLALEEAIEAWLDAARAAVAGHPVAADAFGRYHGVARSQRDALRNLLQSTGAPEAPRPSSTTGAERESGGGASGALREAYALFNQAAIGYAALHQTAHVFHTGQLGPTLTLAAQHLRGYAAAAQEINQLIADVVAWELRREGQRCLCPCPHCSLGVCWCITDTTDKVNAAWRETASAPPDGLRVAPNTRATPALDVREGDVVLAVNGAPVASLDDVRSAAPSPAPGDPVRLSVRRADGTVSEVVATRQ